MANTVRLTALTSTPICCAASRSCAVARTAQPSLVKRRKTNSSARAGEADPGDHQVERADRAAADLEAVIQQRLGTARGSGEKSSCTSWSSTKLMPMVASSGAMCGVALQRPQAEALDHEAEQRADRHHDHDGQRQRRAEMRHARSRHRRRPRRPSRGRS